MILNKILYGSVTVLDIITAAVILIVAFFLAKTAVLYLRRGLRDKIKADHLEIIYKLVYYGIIIIAAIICLPSLGIKPSGLLVAGASSDCPSDSRARALSPISSPGYS